MDEVALAGLDHCIVCTAAQDKVHLRHYHVGFRRSGSKVGRGVSATIRVLSDTLWGFNRVALSTHPLALHAGWLSSRGGVTYTCFSFLVCRRGVSALGAVLPVGPIYSYVFLVWLVPPQVAESNIFAVL